jgi:hypothetical protein
VYVKGNIARDFMHLSQAIATAKESIPYELIVILENCLEDKFYKQEAITNLVAYAKTNFKVKEGLTHIIKNNELAVIKPIAEEILNSASSKV